MQAYMHVYMYVGTQVQSEDDFDLILSFSHVSSGIKMRSHVTFLWQVSLPFEQSCLTINLFISVYSLYTNII